MAWTKLKPRFSLRTLLFVVLLFSVVTAWLTREYRACERSYREEVAARARIKKIDRDVYLPQVSFKTAPRGPKWICWATRYGFTDVGNRVTEVNYRMMGGTWLTDQTEAHNDVLEEFRHFPYLERTYWPDSFTTLRGFRGLSNARHLSELDLSMTDATDQWLAAIKDLEGLEILYGPEIGDITDAGIAHLENLRNLKFLKLGGNITDDSLRHLAKMPKLETLIVEGTITGKGCRYLRELPALTWLDLRTGHVDRNGLEAISEIGSLESLRVQGDFGDNDFGSLRNLKNLRELAVVTKSSRLGPNALRDISQIRSLQWLAIICDTAPGKGSSITNDEVKALRSTPRLTELYLTGDHPHIDDGALPFLAAMPALKVFDGSGTSINESRARRELPAKVTVQWYGMGADW